MRLSLLVHTDDDTFTVSWPQSEEPIEVGPRGATERTVSFFTEVRDGQLAGETGAGRAN
jgi:hypothetical protein